jgi:hypothetical protein
MLVRFTVTLSASEHLLYWRHNPAPLEIASIVITRQSLPPTRLVYSPLLGRTTGKPASRYAVHSAQCTACCSAGQKESQPANCNTNAPFQGQQFHSQPANCNTNAPFQGQQFYSQPASQLTATQTPFSGPAILQPASWHDGGFARLPWSPVTLIVNICYSGCLQISTSHNSEPHLNHGDDCGNESVIHCSMAHRHCMTYHMSHSDDDFSNYSESAVWHIKRTLL